MRVDFTVNGKPKGKARPRFNIKTKKTYTPNDTVKYEKSVKEAYKKKYDNLQLEGPIKADIVGIFPIPESTNKKNKFAMINGKIRYTKKIDADNLAKSVLDALNGVAYKDDSQIYSLNVIKKYGIDPRVDVSLTEVPNFCDESIQVLFFY